MRNDSEEPKVVEEAPTVKSRLSIVVILAMLLGILMTLGAGGAFLHYQKSKALQAEVLALRDSLKEKSLALDEMAAQIEVLSRQMHVLKEYSIAHSSTASGKDKKADGVVPVTDSAANAPKSPATKEKTGSPELPSPTKAKKPKPDAQNCELVGKSPEDQAATLKRCVNLIDPPKEKPRAR